MAVEVRDTKPRFGLSAQMKICVGRAVALPNGLDGPEVPGYVDGLDAPSRRHRNVPL